MEVISYQLPFVYQKKEYVADVHEFQPGNTAYVRASINTHSISPRVFLFYKDVPGKPKLWWYYDERKEGMIEVIAGALLKRMGEVQ